MAQNYSSLAPAALAGALLYTMYKINVNEDQKLVAPATGKKEEDELCAQLVSSGISTPMLSRGFGYAGPRTGVGFNGDENTYADYVGPEGVARYTAQSLMALREIYAREVFNDNSVTFQIPAPTIKPTYVYYKGGPLPGISPNYLFSQIDREPIKKIGRAEDKW